MKHLIALAISLLITSLTITLSPLNAQSPPVPPALPSLNRPALLLALTLPTMAPTQVTAQSKDLIPQKTDKGVLFQCSAPGATAVYLAGDFNNWASNSNGVITDPAAKMTGPDSKGLWQMTVKLAPGDHSFKFCVNGAAELWLTPDWAIDRDADGNAVIHVTADGSPLLHSTAKTNAVLISALCFFVFVSVNIIPLIIGGARQARTIRLMIEKGQPVPPELVGETYFSVKTLRTSGMDANPIEKADQSSRARDLSIDYLRTTITLLVIAVHSAMAYCVFAPAFTVVDSARWMFFDYFAAFNDTFFMSLMFFISGLFVYASMRRHGTLGFIYERFVRLGLPFVFSVMLVMPLVEFAPWILAGKSGGFFHFYMEGFLPVMNCGPAWFLWVLLLFNGVSALLVFTLKKLIPRARDFIFLLQNRPVVTRFGAYLISFLLYWPLYAQFSDRWIALITPPFWFQPSRIGVYAFWFFFGCLIGVSRVDKELLDRGLPAKEGSLARNWIGRILNGLIAGALLYGAHRSGNDIVYIWVTFCVVNCFGFLALFRRLRFKSNTWMNSLVRSAYAMYLVHYVFVLWTQVFLLNYQLPAPLKFLIVFICSTILSWGTAQILIRIPGVRRVI